MKEQTLKVNRSRCSLWEMVALILIVLAVALFALTGCKTAQLAPGGAYAPLTTNAAGQLVPATQPEQGLYVADAAYKLAYDTVDGVLKFERDNRAQVAAISPKIKAALDVVRPKVTEVELRWAVARKAYKANPTPAGLTTIQSIIAEIQRLVPVAQAEIQPVYATVTAGN